MPFRPNPRTGGSGERTGCLLCPSNTPVLYRGGGTERGYGMPASRERLAYHEAGHAVAYSLSGRHVRWSRIVPDAKRSHPGATKARIECSRILSWDGRSGSRRCLEGAIIGALGGPIAEERYAGQQSFGAVEDLSCAREFAARLSGSEAESAGLGWVARDTNGCASACVVAAGR